MNEWYFNSLRLTMILSIMILSVFWYIISSSNSICSRFYFYINSITRLSWPLIFLQFLFFGKNAHRGGGRGRKEGKIERIIGSRWRAASKDGGIASQRVGVRIFALASTRSIVWYANVAHEVFVAMLPWFKLEIWKTLENHPHS